jgi:RNase P subunit RPR2
MRFNNQNFVCPKCTNIFPKKNAIKSGDSGYEYGIHVHCNKCGYIVSYN